MNCQDAGCPVHRLPTRRSLIAGFACAAALPAAKLAAAPAPASAEDERFMRMAIDEARQADFPFGAVIVRDGAVIARGRNLGRTNRDPTAHGEMVAIRRCLAEHGPAALRGSTLYTSGEPCAMCMGAILWCHVGRLVFAASVDAARHQDRPDHAVERRGRRQGAVRPDHDHRRRAGGRGDGSCSSKVAASHDRHPCRQGRAGRGHRAVREPRRLRQRDRLQHQFRLRAARAVDGHDLSVLHHQVPGDHQPGAASRRLCADHRDGSR